MQGGEPTPPDRRPRRRCLRTGAAALLGVLFAAGGLPPAAFASEATLDDKPAPESVADLGGALEEGLEEEAEEPAPFVLPPLKSLLQDLPPFFRDTQLDLHLRTYYFDRRNLDESRSETWAYGGSLEYRSGWWKDAFAVGAELFTSQRAEGRKSRDGTLLLRPRQRSYTVLGKAYAKLRYREHLATLYRQEIDLPYVNKQDSRMTPNTFEAYTLRGRFGGLTYVGGFVAEMKERNDDDFEPMSEVAGVDGTSKGLAMAGVQYQPNEHFRIGGINYFLKDVLNIFYAEAAYVHEFNEELAVRLGAQFTDQRSVGDDLLTGSYFDTRVFGGRVAASYRGAILRVAFSSTDNEERIRSPFGSYPGYLSLMQRNFNRAGEDAWLVGLSYHFGRLGLEGLSAVANYAQGKNARDPDTGFSRPDERTLDLTVDYQPQRARLRGWWLRLRGSVVKQSGTDQRRRELRVILRYDFSLL